MPEESRKNKIARVIAQAWLDAAFKERLKADPKRVLADAGISTAQKVVIIEDTDDITHFVIPKRPSRITDEDLKKKGADVDFCCTEK